MKQTVITVDLPRLVKAKKHHLSVALEHVYSLCSKKEHYASYVDLIIIYPTNHALLSLLRWLFLDISLTDQSKALDEKCM